MGYGWNLFLHFRKNTLILDNEKVVNTHLENYQIYLNLMKERSDDNQLIIIYFLMDKL